jgi:hypothetical protein
MGGLGPGAADMAPAGLFHNQHAGQTGVDVFQKWSGYRTGQ